MTSDIWIPRTLYTLTGMWCVHIFHQLDPIVCCWQSSLDMHLDFIGTVFNEQMSIHPRQSTDNRPKKHFYPLELRKPKSLLALLTSRYIPEKPSQAEGSWWLHLWNALSTCSQLHWTVSCPRQDLLPLPPLGGACGDCNLWNSLSPVNIPSFFLEWMFQVRGCGYTTAIHWWIIRVPLISIL